MDSEVLEVILRVIDEVNWKVLYEAEQRGIGRGIELGKNKVMEDIAVKLKDTLCAERISEITGLPLSQIEKL